MSRKRSAAREALPHRAAESVAPSRESLKKQQQKEREKIAKREAR